jgi:allantoinase
MGSRWRLLDTCLFLALLPDAGPLNGESLLIMAHALRSTRVLTPNGFVRATVLIDQESIAAILPWEETPAGAHLHDFVDDLLLPGLVDSHVHINEPGRTEWEGFHTATQAAAAGGVTTLVDMPLNCIPETIDVPALNAKRSAAEGKAWVDWAAWGGVVRGNAEQLPALAKSRIPGFKCFLIHSGIDGFAWVDESDLHLAMEKLRGSSLPLLAHAEVSGPVDRATQSLNAEGSDWRKYATYLASRPDSAEIDAIALLVRLAEEFGARIHIVHLASAQALPLLAAARKRGLPITVETCVQYLWFAAEQIPDCATQYKCAPPIRNAANREELWDALERGLIDMVTTDHSPCPPAMKRREEGRWDQAWGGIASLGLALPVLNTAMARRGIKLERISEWMAAAPAQLAGLSQRKGAIAPGSDADFAVFNPDTEWTVTPADLHFRHKLSPYIGAKLRGRVRETWLRGEPVFSEGRFIGAARGREQVRS